MKISNSTLSTVCKNLFCEVLMRKYLFVQTPLAQPKLCKIGPKSPNFSILETVGKQLKNEKESFEAFILIAKKA
jgi:hypothetical protein